jgi:hypothetical protein
MFPGAAVEFLYSLMDQIKPSGADQAEARRWAERRAEIPRAVKSAEKFAPRVQQPTVEVSDQDVQLLQPPALLNWQALANTQPTEPAWVLNNWLPRNTTTLLAANGGVGKSNLALQLAVAATQGTPLFNIATQKAKVMVLSAEDETRTVHFRVANICAEQGISLPALHEHLYIFDATNSDSVLFRAGLVTDLGLWLAQEALRRKIDLLIIDNASDVFADNENDRSAVRTFMRYLAGIARDTGAAVLLLSHVDKASVRMTTSKDTGTSFSGSTAWNNSARSRWAMYRDQHCVTLVHEKSNVGALQPDVQLEFDPATKVFVPFGSIVGSAFAAAMVRKSQELAILTMISECEQSLSTKARARNNAHVVLCRHPKYPARLARDEFFARIEDLKARGLLSESTYKGANRQLFEKLCVTTAGLEYLEAQTNGHSDLSR